MAALCHAWSNRSRQTDRAACSLGVGGSQNLKNGIPAHIDIGICGLSMVLSVWSDNETVVGMNIASFVNSMIARTKSPNGIPPMIAVVEVVLVMVVRAGWQSKVHEMCYGGLTLPAIDGPHGRDLSHGVFVDQARLSLLLVILPQ